jgi:adenylate kinase family enzyme
VTRVAIVGNAGGGKSTLRRALSRRLGLPLYALDQIQWQPGWVATAAPAFERRHRAWIQQPRWIIDGLGPVESLEARFEAADTIVLLDHPLWRHYWWAAKRQVMCLFRPRVDGPPGCPMLPVTWRLARLIWRIHRDLRPRLLKAAEACRGAKAVYHLRGPADVKRFLAMAGRQS